VALDGVHFLPDFLAAAYASILPASFSRGAIEEATRHPCGGRIRCGRWETPSMQVEGQRQSPWVGKRESCLASPVDRLLRCEEGEKRARGRGISLVVSFRVCRLDLLRTEGNTQNMPHTMPLYPACSKYFTTRLFLQCLLEHRFQPLAPKKEVLSVPRLFWAPVGDALTDLIGEKEEQTTAGVDGMCI
jgi:hypothetical protein